jgi:hypothetical protein
MRGSQFSGKKLHMYVEHNQGARFEYEGQSYPVYDYQDRTWRHLNFFEHTCYLHNAFVESFNGSFRDECLNAHWFLSLEDAAEKIEAWRQEYNHYRPHRSFDDMTPAEFIQAYQKETRENTSLEKLPLSKKADGLNEKQSSKAKAKPSNRHRNKIEKKTRFF